MMRRLHNPRALEQILGRCRIHRGQGERGRKYFYILYYRTLFTMLILSIVYGKTTVLKLALIIIKLGIRALKSFAGPNPLNK